MELLIMMINQDFGSFQERKLKILEIWRSSKTKWFILTVLHPSCLLFSLFSNTNISDSYCTRFIFSLFSNGFKRKFCRLRTDESQYLTSHIHLLLTRRSVFTRKKPHLSRNLFIYCIVLSKYNWRIDLNFKDKSASINILFICINIPRTKSPNDMVHDRNWPKDNAAVKCFQLKHGRNNRHFRTVHVQYLIFNWFLKQKHQSEFRYESPISISKWNNWLDFGRKSENYFKVKVFSDSRPKSAQKLILKVFSDFETQIICRLSKFFEFLNSMVYMC